MKKKVCTNSKCITISEYSHSERAWLPSKGLNFKNILVKMANKCLTTNCTSGYAAEKEPLFHFLKVKFLEID